MPQKIKKYQVGGEVTPNFPMENEAITDANRMGQELKEISLENIEPEFPTTDAMYRSENYQLGGPVRPPMSPSISPNMPSISPNMPRYKKGGKVK